MKKAANRILLLTILACGMQCTAAQESKSSDEASANDVPGHFDMSTCAPAYPMTAKMKDERGTTKLLIVVDESGKFKQASVALSSGYPDLDRAAFAAAMRCVFTPRLIGGKPTPTTFTATFNWQP